MKNYKAPAAVIAAGVLWGIISIFIRLLSAAGLESLQIGFVRNVFAFIVLLVIILVKDKDALKINIRDVWMFLGTGILSTTLFSWCNITVVRESQASLAVVLLYTSPIFVSIMSAIFFHEKMTMKKIIALVMTFCGVVLVAGIVGGGVHVSARILAIGLCSGFCYALYSIFGKAASAKYSAATTTLYTFMFATIGFFVMCHPADLVAKMNAHIFVISLMLSFICSLLPFFLYTYGLGLMESGKAAILVTTEPVVGSLVGIFLFGEDHSPVRILGMLLVFSAIIILNMPARGGDDTDKS
ncbi:MAG: EamA family transporter [Eubacteriaceae bacterium]|jgi:drug/metabolite transporter (DMT)-like permease|nr:EamA family transporter [Eubacteriaceae bacterium]